jgi:hypothetical protein
MRAMIDSGAETNLVLRSAVERLGNVIQSGHFGWGVGAFGNRVPLTAVTHLNISFLGVEPSSGVSREFDAKEAEELIVVNQLASDDYDMLLGLPCIKRMQGDILSSRTPLVVQFTAESGEITEVLPIERQVETAEHEAQRLQVAAMTHIEVPELVMTSEELAELWKTAEPGTVKVFPIVMHHEMDCGGVRVNNIAFKSAEETRTAAISPTDPLHAEGVEARRIPEAREGVGLLPSGAERDAAAAVQKRLTEEFKDVFPDDLPNFDPTANPRRGIDSRTHPDARPFGRYGPRMTAGDAQLASKMIRELLAKGFIRGSQSPWGAPMFLVAKPDGSKRMVIDYRGLNAATIRNRYPLPRVDELFDQLRGARFFSKLDLRSGYWQMGMDPAAVEKTAFTSREGHFEWLVLPMGLTNAPAEFMHMMEETFREQLNKSVLVFLDDILIFSKTLQEHEQHLRWVLERLREKKLYGKLSKCEFFRQEVEFLGHMVGRGGVRMVDSKVEAVQKWPTPTKQKEVEQFLGLAGYYRRFVADFSSIAAPLSQLCGTVRKGTKKGAAASRVLPKVKFRWEAEQQSAFDKLKVAVTAAPCLAMPDPNLEFIVHTDVGLRNGRGADAAVRGGTETGCVPVEEDERRGA